MAKRKTPASANTGAADTRAAIVRKVRRMVRENPSGCTGSTGYRIACYDLLEWIADMDKRASARKGGLGRK